MKKYLLKIINKFKSNLSSLLLILIFCALPLSAILIYSYTNFWGKLISVYIVISINLFILWLFKLNTIAKIGAISLKLTEIIFAQLIIKTQGPFDIFYVLDNLDVVPDIIFSYTAMEITIFFGSTTLMVLFYYLIARKIRFHLTNKIILSAVLALILIQTTSGRYVFFDRLLFASSTTINLSAIDYPLVSNLQKVTINKDENIILLHVESWNSKAVNGDVLIDNELYQKPMAPVYLEYSNRGLYFPEFYGNSMQTIRSQENTLCGIANNLGEHYSKREEAFNFKCLPKIFSENGFKTYFFKADDITFHGTKNFMEKIGFDVVINKEIMKEGDTEHYWGYQDDIFYQRIFEFLEKESLQKKFIYIAVSTLVHEPYYTKEELSFLDEFDNPKNTYELYANCMKEEDYMLKAFFRYYDKYLAENTHLFIFGDTSVPVGINDGNVNTHRNIYDDNFLTTLLYIPPNKSDINPKIITKRYSQINLFHTIVELFAENYQTKYSINEITSNNLNNKPYYIRLNQPYSGKSIAIVGYPDKWIYSFENQNVIYFNLETDRFEQNPLILSTNASVEEFSTIVSSKKTDI